jgi:hypothetical protein
MKHNLWLFKRAMQEVARDIRENAIALSLTAGIMTTLCAAAMAVCGIRNPIVQSLATMTGVGLGNLAWYTGSAYFRLRREEPRNERR